MLTTKWPVSLVHTFKTTLGEKQSFGLSLHFEVLVQTEPPPPLPENPAKRILSGDRGRVGKPGPGLSHRHSKGAFVVG